MSNVVSMPLPIGIIAKSVVIECVRNWAAGAALSERERAVMDEALALNRMDMLHAMFSGREVIDDAR